MASSLSRRLSSTFLNKNPSAVLRQSISLLRSAPQPKSDHLILLGTPPSPVHLGSSSTAALFHCGVPTHPLPNPTKSLATRPPPTIDLPKPNSSFPSRTATKPVHAALLEKPVGWIPRFGITNLGFPPAKPLSTIPNQSQPQGGAEGAGAGPRGGAADHELRSQEIVGPTVERDVSALANETRQVLGTMRKTIYELSASVALLGVTHLCLGAWIVYSSTPPAEVSVQGIGASSFLLALALLMRQTLKPLAFFNKMEERGRLQILTLTLQVSKNLNSMLSKMRVVTLFSVFAITLATALCFRRDDSAIPTVKAKES